MRRRGRWWKLLFLPLFVLALPLWVLASPFLLLKRLIFGRRRGRCRGRHARSEDDGWHRGEEAVAV